MKYIYIDSLFFLSLFTDYLLCLITARICRICLRRRRYLAAALLGAAYSVSVFLPDLSFMASRWMELVSAALMGLIAFGGERRMFRCMAVFLAVSATFGGAIWALSLQTGALPVIDLRLLIGCFAVCYTVLSIIARSRSRAADRRTAAIELSLNGRHCCFTALIDSGNCLSDPVTGAEIVVDLPGRAEAAAAGERGAARDSRSRGACDRRGGEPGACGTDAADPVLRSRRDGAAAGVQAGQRARGR